MKFLLDHDVPAEIARVLAQAGHDVTTVRQVMSPMAPDLDVLKNAAVHSQILVTCNRDDFLREAEGVPHAGIVVLIRRRTRIAECAALIRLIQKAGESGMCQNISFA